MLSHNLQEILSLLCKRLLSWVKCNVIKGVVFTLLVKPIANYLGLKFHKYALTNFVMFLPLDHFFKLPFIFSPSKIENNGPRWQALFVILVCIFKLFL